MLGRRPTNVRYVGSWEIQRRVLGSGAWAEVRLAVNTRTRVVAACKIVPKDVAAPPEEGQSPAAREAKLLRLLSHPGLLKIYEVLEDGAFHYIFLEYCPGGDLFDFVKAAGKLEEPAAARIFCEILSTIVYIHSEGFAHRDLKLENILIDESGKTRVSDLGDAVALCSGRAAERAGSPPYWGPEAAAGQPYSPALQDVWSLGCLLHCLLTGEMPALAGSGEGVVADGVGPEVRDLLQGMLRREAAGRLALSEVAAHPWVLRHVPGEQEALSRNPSTPSLGSLAASASSPCLAALEPPSPPGYDAFQLDRAPEAPSAGRSPPRPAQLMRALLAFHPAQPSARLQEPAVHVAP
jgi:serine/threonine protein kinase